MAVVPSYPPPPPEPFGGRPGGDFKPSGSAVRPHAPGSTTGHGPPQAAGRVAPAAPVADSEAFQARLRPSLLGSPKGALVTLVLVALGVALLLVVLLAK